MIPLSTQPHRSYVPLSEAIQWIYQSVAGQTPLTSMSDFDLNEAMERLADRGGNGVIGIRGRYIRSLRDLSQLPYADTVELTPSILRDYRHLHVSKWGLQRGTGITSNQNGPSFDEGFARWTSRSDDPDYFPDDGYFDVEVCRDDLMREFPAPPLAAKPSHDEVVSWCRHWIETGKGNGSARAWAAFQKMREFKGCSRDDVFRPAWNEAKTKV